MPSTQRGFSECLVKKALHSMGLPLWYKKKITLYDFLYFLGNLRGVISITFFPPRPRFSPIGQRKVQKSDFRCLPGAVNRGINIFFPFFQVFTDFVDEYKVRSAMKLFFSRNSCLIYSAISNE